MCHQVIEHVDNPAEFLDYMIKFVKDDGKLILSSVTDQFNYDRFHMFSFDKEDFDNLLGSRFKNVEIEIFDVPSRPKSQILGVGDILK
jgi:2-polyprenyl-3-methyl-5-hydroxy-6-metoxy-1,4-benzoquinol methylase